MQTESSNFPIELVVDVEHQHPLSEPIRTALYAYAEKELRRLAKGHTDIIGAQVTVKAPRERANIPLYEVTATAYVRPTYVAATETASDPMDALRAALHAVERQVRSQRERLRGY